MSYLPGSNPDIDIVAALHRTLTDMMTNQVCPGSSH